MSSRDRHDDGPNDRPENRKDGDTPAGRIDDERLVPELTHEDFQTLPIERLATRMGLTPPEGDSPEEERAWREKAWQNHVKDLEHRDEWGTATQATKPPQGDDPNL